MKGLIIKDLYCLKKEIRLFLGTTIGSVLVSVLFLLSARYGNIADALADIQASEMISGEKLLFFTDMLAVLVIFLPIALTGSLIECFKEDSKAGFMKIALSMPLSCKQIVGSRYMTCLLFFTVCFLSSTLCSVFVTSVSESLQFAFVIKGIACVCAVFMIYMSLVMLLLYLFGTKKSDLIQTVPIMLVFIVECTKFAKRMEQLSDDSGIDGLIGIVNDAKTLLEKHGFILLDIAICCMAASFLMSVKIMENKRGSL